MATDERNGTSNPDTVKLFVGQIPRSMTEEQLLPLFQEAGTVHELSIIKDRATKASRGCCFLIYQTKQEADNAIALFHNKRKLPPLQTPLQVKYADGELERLEHKLFVGMVPKTVTEDELRAVFSPFGAINEITIIKGSQASKGCAFLKYEARTHAMAAINALNGKYKMEGSSFALVVKWADTEKEREARRRTQLGTTGTLQPQAAAAYGNLPPLSYTVGAATLNGYGYQAQNPYSLPPYSANLSGQSAVSGGVVGATNALGSMPSSGYDLMGGAGSILGASYGATQSGGYSYPNIPNVQYQGVYQPSTLGQGAVNQLYQTSGLPAANLVPPVKTASISPQAEGPPGANLFIYHLPAEYGDQDLSQSFQPFGNVLSAKVFVDKNTGLSKCFGFVSFSSPEAAQAAINTMNGSPLGGKRLKVQLKRDSRQNKPY